MPRMFSFERSLDKQSKDNDVLHQSDANINIKLQGIVQDPELLLQKHALNVMAFS